MGLSFFELVPFFVVFEVCKPEAVWKDLRGRPTISILAEPWPFAVALCRA